MKNTEKKLYTDARWNDTSRPIVIGHREFTEEEKKEIEEKIKAFNKRHGIVLDDEE